MQVVQDSLSTNVSMFVRGMIFILAVLTILMLISPALTGVVFGGIIPILIFGVCYGRQMRKLSRNI